MQTMKLLISLGYLLPFDYLFLNGLAYSLQRPIGTAGFWFLILGGAITLAPLATTVLLAKIVRSGDQ